MTVSVIYTEQAERELRDIYEYIAFKLLKPETAKKQAKRIMNAIFVLCMVVVTLNVIFMILRSKLPYGKECEEEK